MPQSWLPSRSSSCCSATSSSFISGTDCSSCPPDSTNLVADGPGALKSGHHQERRHRHHRHNPPLHCSGDRHVAHGCAVNDPFTTAPRRVQTSEHTRFTSILASGGRCGDSAESGAAPAGPRGRVDGGSSRIQDVAWWRSSTVAANITIGAVSPASCDVHPYYALPSPTSPLPHQQRGADFYRGCRDVAAAQRYSTPSPLLTTASGTLIASPTPLPPTHPRRSSSAQSRASNTVSTHTSGGTTHTSGGTTHTSKSLFASKGGGGNRGLARHAETDGGVPLQPSCSACCVARPTRCKTLRRSFSFTSGVPSATTPGYEALPLSLHRAASPLSSVNAATGALRTLLTGERQHERTASLASSVHSASSSVRPSVPLPPSHVGLASNMMAAMWVDLPLSQTGSRCATPLNNNGDAYPPPRRRRTTPRRCSGPPSPGTSTLAASVASSFDGGGYMSSVAGGASGSTRRTLVTVGTQTESDAGTAKGGGTPPSLSRRLYSRSLSGSYATDVSGGRHYSDAAHQYNFDCPLESEGVAAITATSVSSTSAEVSPRSLLASAAEMHLDNVVDHAALGAEAVGRVQQHIAVGDVVATAPHAPESLPTEATTKADDPSEGGSPSNAPAKPPGTTYVYQTLRVDAPPLRGGTKMAAVSVSAPGSSAAEMWSPERALMFPTTSSLPTLHVPLQTGSVLAASLQPQEGVLPAVGIPSPTPKASSSAEVAGESSLTTGGGEGYHGAVKGMTSVDCGATASLAKDGGPSAPQPVATSASDDVWRLRAELAEMRLQYEHVVQQLRHMQERSVAAGSANSSIAVAALEAGHPTAKEAVLSTTSTSLPAGSASSCLSSVFIPNHSGIAESPAVDSASFVSSSSEGNATDAATTLDHVREALQRTRKRTTH
ncbi:hypothetical protein, unknown function [Leishmania braziliensis MHOM/BR/75/M2904]|uniref:Uncharacterized protein n=2 Tax=Leishmania braziliensis TaxID=5660 RepID=A4H701_LEIBR|nr:hypothetical protein, unknown function [Leishmania braziliensis MHOM/BR/75/M2904]CAJ2468496.1 unnamed protein product [Leishmania braziliensis]CAM37462.1 hypothetical protein, unknown function [Leishmania braziliensis MHOM/BR/75/M2904]